MSVTAHATILFKQKNSAYDYKKKAISIAGNKNPHAAVSTK